MVEPLFAMPADLFDEQGEPRRAGFEFEFGNIGVKQLAVTLQQRFGGSLQETNAFEITLTNSELGTLKIERDANLLTSLKYRDWLQQFDLDENSLLDPQRLDQEVDQFSRWLIPCEIVTEPLPFQQIAKLAQLNELLLSLDAQGTQSAPHYAFGLHINISLRSTAAGEILKHIQAFLLLSDWLIDNAATDITRRFFTKFIEPFPEAYYNYVLDPEYQVDQATLINDYLLFNPTRNRPLDLLPLFSELDKERVLGGVNAEEKPLIKARPAFHYRLPDCRVGDPAWSVAGEWQRWLLIEKIANDPQQLQQLLLLWCDHQQQFTFFSRSRWLQRLDAFLHQHNRDLPQPRKPMV